MANEQTTDAPLTAPLGEQLAEKGRLEEAREAERRAGDAQEHRVERKKVEEREAAQRHATLGRAHAAGSGHAVWPVLLGGLALFGAILALRRLVRR
jgi:hypothetical protein